MTHFKKMTFLTTLLWPLRWRARRRRRKRQPVIAERPCGGNSNTNFVDQYFDRWFDHRDTLVRMDSRGLLHGSHADERK